MLGVKKELNCVPMLPDLMQKGVCLSYPIPGAVPMLRGFAITLLDDEIDTLIQVIDAPDFADQPLRKLV